MSKGKIWFYTGKRYKIKIVSYIYRKNSFTEDILRKFSA